MRKMEFSINIDAPRERVWRVLWEDETYRRWAGIFSKGSHIVSEWEEGSEIRFLDSKDDGISGVIAKIVPKEFISFEYVTEVTDGKERSFKGSENYNLKEREGVVELAVEVDVSEENEEILKDKFPEALKMIKVLAEDRRT